MQSTIVVDDQLMADALRATGLERREDVIEAALRELIERRRHDPLADAFGRMPWDGDLNAMRLDQ